MKIEWDQIYLLEITSHLQGHKKIIISFIWLIINSVLLFRKKKSQKAA